MKKKVYFLLIILVIGVTIVIINNKNNLQYTEIDGIKYAITINGESSNTFPIGNYKVDVNCVNASGYWDNTERKVIVENIVGVVTCGISFTSITNSDYLNSYIIGLDNTTQGDGKIVHEMGTRPNYSNMTTVKSYGSIPIYFQNTSNVGLTPQTNIDDYWTFDSDTGTFTSNPSKFTISGYDNVYHAYVKVPEEGYYRLCYTLNKTTYGSDWLNIGRNEVLLKQFSASTSGGTSGCYLIDYLLATDYINISEHAYSGTSSPVMSFRLEKAEQLPLDTGFRYEGLNPNNYVLFNNELWRIIGVFGSTSHGQSSKNLVKIIRDESIGTIAYDNKNNDNMRNNWENSHLKPLLNETYYNHLSDTCNSSNNGSIICDYRAKGIQNGYQGMIENVTWYLGGDGKDGYKATVANSLYRYERDANAIYSGNPASTTGKIGLLYVSDYMFGALESDCSRAIEYSNYNKATNISCIGKNWLFGHGSEWTITPKSSDNKSFTKVLNDGKVSYQQANFGLSVRPVLYLSSSVYRVSGTGSLTDPYIIGM